MLSDYDRSLPLSLSYKDNNFVPYTLNQSSRVIQLDSFFRIWFQALVYEVDQLLYL